MEHRVSKKEVKVEVFCPKMVAKDKKNDYQYRKEAQNAYLYQQNNIFLVVNQGKKKTNKKTVKFAQFGLIMH